MNGAIVLLIVNAAVAGMFALSYFLIAFISRGQRPVLAFGISYLVGMLTPISEIALSITADGAFQVPSYGGLLAAFLLTSYGLSRFERQKPLWRAILVAGVFGIFIRLAIWGGPRDNLAYEIAYQTPFAVALGLCAYTAFRHANGRPLYYLLGSLFGVTSINFLVKPFVAVAVGSGETAVDYANSAYALYSQGSTGILLIAGGLVVLLIVIQTTIVEFTHISETDPLSQLLNRRGYDRQAQTLLLQQATESHDLSLIMIDLDNFKAINDDYGHDVGDRVIQHFAGLLQHSVPKSALVARTGGEEFVILLNHATLSAAVLVAETIREQVSDHGFEEVPRFTFSGGVAQLRPGETLADLKRRADRASYAAKIGGKDRIEIEQPASGLPNGRKVVPLRR